MDLFRSELVKPNFHFQNHEETMTRAALQETPRLAKCIIIYLCHNHEDVSVMFELLDVYTYVMLSMLLVQFVKQSLSECE